MKGIYILTTVLFHVLTLASKGTCLYCIGTKQYWWNSMKACVDQMGEPLPYTSGLHNFLDTQILRENSERNTTIWTGDYLKRHSAKSEKLCGFRYMSSPSDKGQTLYGNCSTNRLFVCRNPMTSRLEIDEGNHESAINTCGTVNIDSIAGLFKPGYYWLNQSRMVEIITFNDERFKLNNYPPRWPFRCGAYSRDAGPYFRRCTDKILSMCHFTHLHDREVNGSCIKDSTTSTKKSLLISSVTPPIYRVSEQTADQRTTTIERTITSIHSTDNSLPYFTNQLLGTSTATQNQTKTHKEDKAVDMKEEEKDSNLGTKVGLPVGLCLALLCVTILSIYISRRYKCWNNAGNENNNTDAKHPNKQSSTGRVVAHVNNSYEANEDIVAMKITNQEGINETPNYLDKNPHYTDLDSEYAVAYKSNLGQNIEERNNLTETDYDVTGNVASCTSNTSNNIYNHFQSEVYDSSANVKKGDICNNEYGIIQSKESESVYDSTGQVNDSSSCDNVYNQLSLAISRDGQIDNDYTVNTSKIGQANTSKIGQVKVTDQTYDKLK